MTGVPPRPAAICNTARRTHDRTELRRVSSNVPEPAPDSPRETCASEHVPTRTFEFITENRVFIPLCFQHRVRITAAMEEVEWTSGAAIQLIQEYQKRPELWNMSHPMYRVHTVKYKLWTELAKMFECDITDLRKKLNSIFASHRRVKANLQAGRRTSWFLYPYLRFLPGHLEHGVEVPSETPKPESKSSKRSERDSGSEQTTSEDEDTEEVEEVVVKPEPQESRPKRRCVPQSNTRLGKPLKRKLVREVSKTSQLDSRLLEALKLLKRSELSRKKDECDSFGEYIATSLRKHDERTQSMIKQAINNILFEQEMKKYSGGQYTVVLTNMEENPLVLGDHETEK